MISMFIQMIRFILMTVHVYRKIIDISFKITRTWFYEPEFFENSCELMIRDRLIQEVEYFFKKKMIRNSISVRLKKYCIDEWKMWIQHCNDFEKASSDDYKQLSILHNRLKRLNNQRKNEQKCDKEETEGDAAEKKEIVNFLKENTKSFTIIVNQRQLHKQFKNVFGVNLFKLVNEISIFRQKILDEIKKIHTEEYDTKEYAKTLLDYTRENIVMYDDLPKDVRNVFRTNKNYHLFLDWNNFAQCIIFTDSSSLLKINDICKCLKTLNEFKQKIESLKHLLFY